MEELIACIAIKECELSTVRIVFSAIPSHLIAFNHACLRVLVRGTFRNNLPGVEIEVLLHRYNTSSVGFVKNNTRNARLVLHDSYVSADCRAVELLPTTDVTPQHHGACTFSVRVFGAKL